jgi:hypothetical protein
MFKHKRTLALGRIKKVITILRRKMIAVVLILMTVHLILEKPLRLKIRKRANHQKGMLSKEHLKLVHIKIQSHMVFRH